MAAKFLEGLAGKQPTLFAHWKVGLKGGFPWRKPYESRDSRPVLEAASGGSAAG